MSTTTTTTASYTVSDSGIVSVDGDTTTIPAAVSAIVAGTVGSGDVPAELAALFAATPGKRAVALRNAVQAEIDSALATDDFGTAKTLSAAKRDMVSESASTAIVRTPADVARAIAVRYVMVSDALNIAPMVDAHDGVTDSMVWDVVKAFRSNEIELNDDDTDGARVVVKAVTDAMSRPLFRAASTSTVPAAAGRSVPAWIARRMVALGLNDGDTVTIGALRNGGAITWSDGGTYLPSAGAVTAHIVRTFNDPESVRVPVPGTDVIAGDTQADAAAKRATGGTPTVAGFRVTDAVALIEWVESGCPSANRA
jgi:hypothetical protein